MAEVNNLNKKVLDGSTTQDTGGVFANTSNISALPLAEAKYQGAPKFNGVAAVAAITFSAYKRYADEQERMSSITDIPAHELRFERPRASAFIPDARDTDAFNQLGVKLARAMIAATHASGQMDLAEREVLLNEIKTLEVDAESKALLIDEINYPAAFSSIIESADSIEEAAEIYTTSLLTMELMDEAARNYLTMLAARLLLPVRLTWEIQQEVYTQQAFDDLEVA